MQTAKKRGMSNFVSAATDALKTRTGLKSEGSLQGNPFAYSNLREICYAAAERQGVATRGTTPLEVVGKVFAQARYGTSDFAQVLDGLAEAAMLEGYESVDSTWRDWVRTGERRDFREGSTGTVSSSGVLPRVRENAEYTQGAISAQGEPIRLATYGQLFSITREAIINDELGALADLPRQFGESANATVARLPSAILADNANLRDGSPLFHAGVHFNTGAGALDKDTFATALAAMRDQNKPDGTPAMMRPAFLIVPEILRATAEHVVNSEHVLDGSGNLVRNPNFKAVQVIVDPWLDRLSGHSPAQEWYLVAAGKRLINMDFLNGIETPFLESKEGWHVDGIEYKVRIDVGAAVIDWRAGYGGNL